jgi:hypothetical protein
MTPDDLIGRADLAALFGIAENTLDALARKGIIKKVAVGS